MANESRAEREERLAAKLRENLRRRKAQTQARALGEGVASAHSAEVRDRLPNEAP
jgi:hypothetical protein